MLCGCALGSCAKAAHWQRAQQLMQDVGESAVEANAAKLQTGQKKLPVEAPQGTLACLRSF